MLESVLLITDHHQNPSDLINAVNCAYNVDVVKIDTVEFINKNIILILCFLDLNKSEIRRDIKEKLGHEIFQSVPKLFVTETSGFQSVLLASNVGATHTVAKPLTPEKVLAKMQSIFNEAFERHISRAPANVREGLNGANKVLDKMLTGLSAGGSFKPEDVTAVDEPITEALKTVGLTNWLEYVSHHHAQSYRHSLSVTGIAVAFAQRLGLRSDDQRRIAGCALVHDVGKAFIPLAILDKPGRLTESEMALMQQHSRLGYDALIEQGGFPDDTLMAVLRHHEFLDGSGYPDQVGADQISDLVRIVTIADIFSALIEKRGYKLPFSHSKAYTIMEEMGDKLDRALLAAFRPVACLV